MRGVLRVVAPAMAAFMVLPAAAKPLPNGGVTANEVADVLHTKGYNAEMTKDDQGAPEIKSSTDGSTFRVYFYGCSGPQPRCTAIQFSAAFDLTDGLPLAKINVWNRENRFGRGFLDKENDPFVEMDLDVERGYSTEAIANNLDTWTTVVPAFKKFIGF